MQQLLLRLVQARRFAAADRVRTHITHNRMHIPHDNVYQYAAAHAVLNRTASERERLQDFGFWFGLVPGRLAHYQRRISTAVERIPLQEEEELKVVRDAIFRTGKPSRNVPIAMRYALLCAEKGYAMTALAESVYLVQRFAEPEEGKKFFYTFERRALEAAGKLDLSRRALGAGGKLDLSSGRDASVGKLEGVSVRACVEAGWLAEAAQLVLLLKAKGHVVPPDVLSDLVEDLRAHRKDDLVGEVLGAMHNSTQVI